MASTLSDTLRNLGDTVTSSVSTMDENKKTADLQRNTKDQHSNQATTTDFGAKVSDLDHWLKIVDEKGNKIGPHLLEDEVARERVSLSFPFSLSQ